VFISLNPQHFIGVGEQRRQCEMVRRRSRHPNELGFTYFPGDEPTKQEIGVSVPKNEIDEALSRLPPHFPFVFPVIVGCINYRFPFGAGESHQTGFIFRVSRIDPNPPNPGSLVGIDTRLGDIPASDLQLTISDIGSYAD
jgi:hypothetical protein